MARFRRRHTLSWALLAVGVVFFLRYGVWDDPENSGLPTSPATTRISENQALDVRGDTICQGQETDWRAVPAERSGGSYYDVRVLRKIQAPDGFLKVGQEEWRVDVRQGLNWVSEIQTTVSTNDPSAITKIVDALTNIGLFRDTTWSFSSAG